MFHGFRRDIYNARENAKDDATRSQLDDDIKKLEEFAGVKDGNWDVKAEEKVARAGERYMRDGVAPSPELEGVFSRMKEWFTSIYNALKGSPIDIKMNEDVKGVFDRMLSETPKKESSKIKEKAKSIADAIRKLKPEDLAKDLEGSAGMNKLLIDALNFSIEATARAVELGGSIIDAVNEGVKAFKESESYKFMDEKEKAKAEKNVAAILKDKISPLYDVTIEPASDSGNYAERKSAETFLSEDASLDDKVKDAIADATVYKTRARLDNLAIAEKIIEDYGPVVAGRILLDEKNTSMDPATKVALGVALIKASKSMAQDLEASGDTEKASAVRKNAVNVTNHMMQYMTDLGRGVDAFQLFRELDPDMMLKAGLDIQNGKVRRKLDKAKGKIDDFIEKYGMAERMAIKITEQFAMAKIGDNAKGKESEVKSAVKDIASKGVSDSSVSSIQSISGLSKEESKNIAEQIEKEFDRVFKEERNAITSRMGSMPSRLGGAIGKILQADKPIEAADVMSIIEEYYGITKVDQVFSEKIKAEHDKIAKLKTETEKNVQAIKIASMIYKYVANNRTQTAKKIQGLRKIWPVTSAWVASKLPAHPIEVLWAYWYGNTLSGVPTHVLNIVANAYKTIIELPISSIVALTPSIETAGSGKGSTMKAFNWFPKKMIDANGDVYYQKRVMTYPDVVRAAGMWKAFAQGFGTKGLSNAVTTMMYGTTANVRADLKGSSGVIDALEEMPFKWYNAMFHPLKFVKRSMASADELFFSGAERLSLYNMAMISGREMGLKGPELYSYVHESMGNTPEKISDIRKQAAQDVANDEAVSGKKYSDIKRRAMTSRRVYEIWENSVDDRMIEKSKEAARHWTYNNKPEGMIGQLANAIEHYKANEGMTGAVARLLVPFTRVPANVMNEYLDYTPIGFARVKGKKSKFEMQKEFMKAMVGTTMLALTILGLDDDDESGIKITGNGPVDFNKKAQIQEDGWIPYSIEIGGTRVSYKNSPLFIALGVIGNIADSRRYGDDISEEDIATQLAYGTQLTMAGFFDNSYLSGINGVFSAVTDTRGDLESGAKILSNVFLRPMSGFIPYKGMASYIDRSLDPTVYKSKNFKSAMLSNVPFLRRTTGEKLNVLGEQIEYAGKLFNEKEADPIWNFMYEKNIYFPALPYKPELPGGVEMTEDQAVLFTKRQGEYIKQELGGIEGLNKLYEEYGKEGTQKYINRITSNARRAAKYDVFMMSEGNSSYPDLGTGPENSGKVEEVIIY
jgi:hypothetical protein